MLLYAEKTFTNLTSLAQQTLLIVTLKSTSLKQMQQNNAMAAPSVLHAKARTSDGSFLRALNVPMNAVAVAAAVMIVTLNGPAEKQTTVTLALIK